jgi:hypothetical protein
MNAFYFNQRLSARILAAVALFSLVASLVPMQAFADPAPKEPKVEDLDPSVTICHANNGVNFFNNQTVDAKSIVNLPNGHKDHDTLGLDNKGDIIPEFDYNFDGGAVEHFGGQNLNTAYTGGLTGQQILNSGCNVPAPSPATLTVTKTVAGAGATALPNDFNLMVGSVAVLSGVQTTFTPGAYTVTETNLPNYTPGQWGGDCSISGAVTLVSGVNKTCTITNTYVAPPVLCTDPLATNFNQAGPCVFPPCPVGTTGVFPACLPIEVCPPGTTGVPPACVPVPPPTTCTVVVTSDTADYVIEKSANAQLLTFIHGNWTAMFGAASWIWGDNPVVDPTVSETQTFRKQFGFVGTVTSATLEVASDNTHTATLNTGTANAGGSTFNAPVSYPVTADVAQGNNTLVIGVTNTGVLGSTPTNNPAGLKYRLTIQGTPTTDADCSVPFVVDVCPNIPDVQAQVPNGQVIVNNQCVPIVNGCTNPLATNYNAAATPANPQAANCDLNYASLCGDNPNLLTNASFENPVIAGPWSASTITDWVITKVSDNSSTLGEIWRGLSPSSNGSQHVELDSAEPTKLTQAVTTIPGATYQLRFDFAARSDTAEANNGVLATANATTVVNAITDNTNWTTYGGTFLASSASTNVSLADLGTPADSLGTLVDNAVLCLVSLPDGGGDDDDTYRIQGYTWHDNNRNEEWDGLNDDEEGNEEDSLSGWTVRITNGDGDDRETTTDENGFYYFDVPAGTWTITEEEEGGWLRTTQESHTVTVPEVEEVTFLDSIFNFIIPTTYAAVIGSPYGDYNFGNDRRSGGGGGGGTRVDRTPDGDVLGASDSPKPLVLGDQVSAVPAGAPNTGKGGVAVTVMGQFLALPRRRNV